MKYRVKQRIWVEYKNGGDDPRKKEKILYIGPAIIKEIHKGNKKWPYIVRLPIAVLGEQLNPFVGNVGDDEIKYVI